MGLAPWGNQVHRIQSAKEQDPSTASASAEATAGVQGMLATLATRKGWSVQDAPSEKFNSANLRPRSRGGERVVCWQSVGKSAVALSCNNLID